MLYWIAQLAMLAVGAGAALAGLSLTKAAGLAVLPAIVRTVITARASVLAGFIGSSVVGIQLGGGLLFLTPYKLASVALFVRTLVTVWREGAAPLPAKWFLGTSACLVVYVLIHALLVDHDATGLAHGYKLFSFCLIAVCATQLIRNEDDMHHFQVTMQLVVIVVALAAYREAGWASMTREFAKRLKIMGNDPNYLGTAVATWTFIGNAVVTSRRGRLITVPLALMSSLGLVYVVFATASRGVTISLVFTLLLVPLVMTRRFGTRLGLGVASVALLAAALSFAPTAYMNRVVSTVDVDADSGEIRAVNDSGRRELAARSLKLIADAPLFGAGTRASGRMTMLVRGKGTKTHSSMLRVAEAYGLMVVLVVVLLQLAGFLQALRLRRTDIPGLQVLADGLTLAMIVAWISSQGLPSEWPREVWTCLALVAGLSTVERRLRSPKPEVPAPSVAMPTALPGHPA